MLKERVSCADIANGRKGKMKVFEIQTIFKEDANQIERTIERIRRTRKPGQSGAAQPQQQKHKPRDGRRPPKVTY